MHILFVCRGNICRSAYAEYTLRNELHHMKAKDITVSSRGLLSLSDRPMDPHYVSRLADKDIDATTHHSQPLDQESIRSANLILVFTQSQLDELIDRDFSVFGKIFPIDDFANLCQACIHDPSLKPLDNPDDRLHVIIDMAPFVRPTLPTFHDIADPYQRGDAVYDDVAHRIEQCIHPIAAALAGTSR